MHHPPLIPAQAGWPSGGPSRFNIVLRDLVATTSHRSPLHALVDRELSLRPGGDGFKVHSALNPRARIVNFIQRQSALDEAAPTGPG
ncbi:hypothetical protein Atai01_19570 [Amycolatopsis taiwanensis]|uniref:Uncharacterized protein n=1 Tax=Amycolatopsis taiwanensis TaxID=342230 RepID=A0A9W6QZA0_9PSEU|nr:hypothetical protein Atai01_19570 [Amycolatopsis taiwanensis]